MDFKDFFDTLKLKILSLYDKTVDFYEENKKLSLIIAGSFTVVLICILLICINAQNKNKSKAKNIPEQLMLSENLIIPDGPTLPRDYKISRKTKDKWTEEDSQPWFTLPSDKEIDSLSKSNNAIVNEIIGAAP